MKTIHGKERHQNLKMNDIEYDDLSEDDYMDHLCKFGGMFLVQYINNAEPCEKYTERISRIKLNCDFNVWFNDDPSNGSGTIEYRNSMGSQGRYGWIKNPLIFFNMVDKEKLLDVLSTEQFIRVFSPLIKIDMYFSIIKDVEFPSYIEELEEEVLSEFSLLIQDILLEDFMLRPKNYNLLIDKHEAMQYVYKQARKEDYYLDVKNNKVLIAGETELEEKGLYNLVQFSCLTRDMMTELSTHLKHYMKEVELNQRLLELEFKYQSTRPEKYLSIDYLVSEIFLDGLIFFCSLDDDGFVTYEDFGAPYTSPIFLYLKDDGFKSKYSLYKEIMCITNVDETELVNL